MRPLTPRQTEILDFMSDSFVSRHMVPTIRETMERFQFSSIRGVTVHWDALERKGYIERIPYNQPRIVRNSQGKHPKVVFE